MNGKDLLDKMSEVDPKLIEDADKAAENSENKPKSKRALFIGIGSGMATIAAALAIIVTLNGGVTHKPSVDINNSAAGGVDGLESAPENGVQGAATSAENNSSIDLGVDSNGVSTTGVTGLESIGIKPEVVVDEAFTGYGSLPMISNRDFGVHGYGGGAERIEAGLYTVYEGSGPYSPDGFSPWSLDAELTTMPVFLSNSTTPDVDKMTQRVKNAAKILGIPESELKMISSGLSIGGVGDLSSYRKILEENNLTEEEIEAELDRVSRISGANSSIGGESDRVTIYLNTAGELDFWFNEPYPEIPEGYELNKQDPSPDVFAATVEYLAEEYKELTGYKNPKLARCWGNYEYEYCVYESEGDLEDNIVNFWLNNVKFFSTGENPHGLHIIRIQSTDNLEKLGDYPIYTAQQALWVMQSDRVPEEVKMPEDAEVVSVDLEYENLTGYTAVIPYYNFTVKTDEIDDYSGGLVYRHYKIPAVPEQFLDMTIEDYGVRA